MAVQNCIGDSFRGATWVSLHNGGGVGWGEVINGGFGLVLDGSEDADRRADQMLNWDVSNGVARRCRPSLNIAFIYQELADFDTANTLRDSRIKPHPLHHFLTTS